VRKYQLSAHKLVANPPAGVSLLTGIRGADRKQRAVEESKSDPGGLMIRSLLAVALAAAQLLSWSGGTLFVCLDGDGSYCCMDAGPDSCECCHEDDDRGVEPADAVCLASSDTCRDDHGHEHELPCSRDAAGISNGDPCSCTHVLLSLGSPPAVSRWVSAAADAQRLSSRLVSVDGTTSFNDDAPIPVTTVRTRNGSCSANSFPLAVLSTVVLRC